MFGSLFRFFSRIFDIIRSSGSMSPYWSHLRRPHPHFHLHRLPLEVRLEVFGSLTLREWMGLARHNRRTKRVLLSNRRYLAPLARLKDLEIQTSPADGAVDDITQEAFNRCSSILGEEEEEGVLLEQLAKIREGQLSLAQDDTWPTVFLTLSQRFVIQLPVHPRTVAEHRLVRFWLRALSLAYFKNIFVRSVFCPEFLAVLFSPPRSPLLRCSRMKHFNFGSPLPATLGPLICARHIAITLFRDKGTHDWDELFRLLCSTWTAPTRVDIYGTVPPPTELHYMIEACRELPAGFDFRRLPPELCCWSFDLPGPVAVPNAKLLRSEGQLRKIFGVANRWNEGVSFEVETENWEIGYSYTIHAPPPRG